MTEAIDLDEPHRQSPLAVVFLAIKLVRRVGIVQLLIGIVFLWNTILAGSLALLVFAAAGVFGTMGVLSWWRSTFQVVGGELVVHTGVLRSDRLSIPIERIQSLSIEQELLHRVLGLVKVSVDSAGSEATEFEISAVSRPVAEALERATVTVAPISPSIEAETVATESAAPIDDVVVHHSRRRLVEAALTIWPVTGLLFLAPLIAFGDDLVEQFSEGTVESAVESVTWWWASIALFVLIAVSVVANVVRVLLTDGDLTLRASANRIQRTSGLLSRTSRSSSIARIQMVSSRQNLMQRRAGLHWITLSTIGEDDIAVLGCDDAQFTEIRRRIGMATGVPGIGDRRVDPAGAWLPVRNTLVIAGLLAVGGWFVVGWWPVLSFVAVPWRWALAHHEVRNIRWTLGDELAVRRHVFSAGFDEALLYKANSVVVTQSIFERRRDLGRVHLVTAAGTVSVGMVPIAEAEAVRDTILMAAATDRRRWM